jgi:predicted TIM-barrel fold metal-dependent hydrolase
LIEEMDYYHISEALVFNATARETDIEAGNQELLREISGVERLNPSWVLAPEQARGPDGAAQFVGRMLGQGVKAARVFPTLHGFPMSEWLIGDVLSELERHAVPLFIDYGNQHWSDKFTDWDQVYTTCTDHPGLPVILVHEGLATLRMVLALFGKCHKLHIELSYYQPGSVIELVCSEFGPERLIFGSGMPVYDPGLPISLVAYSRVDRDAKEAIAGGNLRRLLEGVV